MFIYLQVKFISKFSASLEHILKANMVCLFDYARPKGFPTTYPELKTAVTVDVLEAGFILAFVILATCLYLIMPGIKGGSYRWNVFIRITLKIIVGAVLMVCNFGQRWETGVVRTNTSYKAGTAEEIVADISVSVGLRSVNITLKRVDEPVRGTALEHETINYNERFWWTWDQGRFGFGPYAGVLQRSFREAQRRGLPLPVLWVADYFTWDGEGLRFGRHYRTAGWYTHICLWTAFPCWILANFFFLSSVRFGAVFTCLMGALQLLASFTWIGIRNSVPLVIPFEGGEITMRYGPNFWLTVIGGVVCTLVGLLLLLLDCRFPDEISTFFGIDPLAEYEEYHLTAEELTVVRRSKNKNSSLNMVTINDGKTLQRDPFKTQPVLKRRATIRLGQKSLYRKPTLDDDMYQDVSYEDDAPQYQNLPSRSKQLPYRSIEEEDV
ncbi:dual oxidase maturation factor 1-like isoform X2 [Bacillus rossius redtenbacheri]|uniref:dual oxidase maturation factor 1-like isoform X2 n=2 Tax=Bacillus rossius redtenbacheri TaxID=93214 RepID=UPI002FDD5733